MRDAHETRLRGRRFLALVGRLFDPRILVLDLRILFGGKLGRDIEHVPKLRSRLALDENTHRQARQVQERLDIHKVGGGDQIKQHILFNLDEIRIPLLDQVFEFGRLEGSLDRSHGFFLVVLAKLNHLLQDNRSHVGQGNVLDFLRIFLVFVDSHGDKLRHFGHHEGDFVNVALLAGLCVYI